MSERKMEVIDKETCNLIISVIKAFEVVQKKYPAFVREYFYNKAADETIRATYRLECEMIEKAGFNVNDPVIKAVRKLRREGDLSAEEIAHNLNVPLELVKEL
ncbi:MAG: hypothetical protein IJU07_09220 [Synergistaceae bacterium]|nr:hypothetical protein [Synergistaceae bacterium]